MRLSTMAKIWIASVSVAASFVVAAVWLAVGHAPITTPGALALTGFILIVWAGLVAAATL